jgi:hypothetical protein
MYKLEKSEKKLFSLFILEDAEDADGNKIKIRKLIRKQKVKEFLKGIEEERKLLNQDMNTVNERLTNLDEIKLLIEELDANA